MEWAQLIAAPAAVPAEERPLRRLAVRFFDWEDWLTFALAAGVVLGVSISLEDSGWSRDMPELTRVGLLALLFALLLARSPLHLLLAWPAAVAVGAGVVAWQTLEAVGPGSLEARIDAVYFRFERWFHLAFSGGISNDSLPFNTLVVGLTWLGVFLSGWSIYRWHNAWLGLIPGGIALFMNMLFIDDTLPLEVFLYVMCGFLLVMRTNLVSQMRRWRAEGISYPPLISLSYLHYTLWAGLFLMAASWIAPVGPFTTPAVVDSLSERFASLGVDFARLAGPLRVHKIVPVHDYTAVLPFQGSIDLGERELLSVKVRDPFIEGPIILRGAVYEEYASGGWKAGSRREVDVPAPIVRPDTLDAAGAGGRIVPITVTVEAKSVVGTVLFTPGQPLSAGVPARAKLTDGSVTELPTEQEGTYQGDVGSRVALPADGGASLTDDEVLERMPEGWTGLYVRRDDRGAVRAVGAVPAGELPDILVLSPREKLEQGESYTVLGLVRDIPPDELRAAPSFEYPQWVARAYLGLPEMPGRVADLARQVAGVEPTAYDQAKAIESYLRAFPIDYGIGDTPPGHDTVDYFLFEAKAGYFDYHASAMVVLLRSLGVPARLAAGFVVDRQDFDRDAGAYVVRDQDVYAWAEVYFPGEGWVEFNPSPDRPAELRPTETGGDIEVPPVDLDKIRDLPVSTGGIFPFEPPDLSGQSGGAAGGGSGLGYAPWITLGVVGFLAAVAGSAALGWRRSVDGLPYQQQLWEKTVRLASWAGCPPRPGQTPASFAGALARRFRSLRDVDLLAQAYGRSRFGRRDALESEERQRLARAWAKLRGTLAWQAVRRLWRRR
ncbi:MAG: transglutaminase domain-containing protein [Dehalococcoidia bacterium]|nr:transglutaminase domain-containing protein [Dehalococcoidia bacterium]